ncbi:MAG: DUF4982 domain-containing protein [Oscillospiraceae bacterium]|nr:DUF4982 domain-containing protein [Oscillospiraceae bacterium]
MSENQLLSTGWKFIPKDEPNAYYKGFDDSAWQTVTLPHDWSVSFPFDRAYSSGTGYLPGGTGWYRKTLELPGDLAGKSVFITFGGVYNNSRVWCNSNYLGKRPYGYSSFTYDISQFVVPGKNVISVNVEHTDIADSRWFTGSGIYRDVTLRITSPMHFAQGGEGIFVYSQQADESKAVLAVKWKLQAGEAETEFVLIDANSQIVAAAKGHGAAGTTLLEILNPALWSCDSPNLYTLISRAIAEGEVRDEERTAVGLRSFRFDSNEGFFLNGINMKLKGVCLHHDAGALGAAVPKDVWRRRLQKLKDAGCNAIRTSHNPPDTLLLDLCDEMGFLVIDEAFDEWEGCKNKWWQGHNVYPPKHFGYADDFPQWHMSDLADMVRRDRNHPCVILWSIGNEVDYPNDPYVHPSFALVLGNNDKNKPEQERIYDPNKPDAARLGVIAKSLAAIVKEHDTTRPVTAALAFPELSDIIGYTDALDVAGYNYKEHLYESDHEKYPGRIILGSENGTSADKWACVRDSRYIAGQFLWTGVDYMGEAAGWPVRVATPGLLNLAGFEKPLYYLRKALWSAAPAAALATSISGEIADERFCWNYEPDDRVIISCYTNCYAAELFLNGRTLGKQTLSDTDLCRTVWHVPFEEGELVAVCEGSDGERLISKLQTAKAPAKILLAPDKTELQANGRDIAQIEVFLEDENGAAVTHSDLTIRFSVNAFAQIIGIENGCKSDLTPYTSNSRQTENGRMIVYLRAGQTAGEAVLTASAPCGLRETLWISMI